MQLTITVSHGQRVVDCIIEAAECLLEVGETPRTARLGRRQWEAVLDAAEAGEIVGEREPWMKRLVLRLDPQFENLLEVTSE